MAWVGLLPLMGCALIWILPESPRWLVQEQKPNEAAQALRKLRQSNDIEAELIEIQEEETAANKQDLGILQVLSSSEFRWPLITSLVLNAIQQLSGINAVKSNSHFVTQKPSLSLIGILLLRTDVYTSWSS